MNLRQHLTLDPRLQRVHNRVSHDGDRVVFIGAVVIGVLLFALVQTGVIA